MTSNSRLSMLIPIEHETLDLPGGPTRLISSGLGDRCIVFFPAVADSALNYVSVLRRLASAGFRAYAVDPPGYGTMAHLPLPSFDILMSDWARMLCNAIDGPKLLVGNSSGGVMATAGLEAEDVLGLVLVGWPVFVEYLPQPRQLMPKSEEEFDTLMARSWYQAPTLGPSARRVLLAQMSEPAIHDHATSLDPVVFLEKLFAYSGPLSFIAGRDDLIVPVNAMQESVKALPRSRFLVIDECGHYPHREQTQVFCNYLIEFVNEITAQPEPTA